jgi:PhoPQ-activated pathogenicity-related protein
MLNLLFMIVAAPRPPRALYDYLNKPDKSFSFKVTRASATRMDFSLTSQTWEGIPWHHSLILQNPDNLSYKGIGILYITGDGPYSGDYVTMRLISAATGMPIAMLFDIPNQPIDGRREDDLIAHTFESYLAHPNTSTPLLFPMTKSAIRAMDAVEQATRPTSNPIKKWVVVGASKRGWTTWMVGAANDPRVKGIAPMVIDTLNIPAQMQHQLASWGQYSDQIKDYTRRGLQEQLLTPRGNDLGVIVDPYSYRKNIRVPTLIVKGSNDPYWTADAMSLYLNDLTEPHWILDVPNTGHSLGSGVMAAATVGAFAQSIAGAFPMPKQKWEFVRGADNSAQLTVTSANPPLQRLTFWVAESDTLDFRNSPYHVASVAESGFGDQETPRGKAKGQNSATVSYPMPANKNVAVFGEMRYAINGKVFALSTPTHVYGKKS